MGRYIRKCRGIGEAVAVMEVSQFVGVRTSARTLALAASEVAAESATQAEAADVTGNKRRKVVPEAPARELQVAYLELRSRSLVMGLPKDENDVLDRLSQCSSNASSEAPVEAECWNLDGEEGETGQNLQAVAAVGDYFGNSRERREAAPSSDLQAESGDLESTVGRQIKMQQQRKPLISPPATEIEDFFAFFEQKEHQRFSDKYNFDVAKEAPLDNGRFEWVPVNQLQRSD